MTTGRMLYIHALSGIHSGTGQSSGIVDLPVARETVTGWPFLPGSAIKGVLRDARVQHAPESLGMVNQIFGHLGDGDAGEESQGNAGGLSFADGRLLAFPARSLFGSFAWVTCPIALARWRRDAACVGLTIPALSQNVIPDEAVLVGPSANDIRSSADPEVVVLNQFDLKVVGSDDAEKISAAIAGAVFEDETWRQLFQNRFGIVSNNLFTFLTKHETEVNARVRLEDERKTVATGALWYEESVPAESIFACPIVGASHHSAEGLGRMFQAVAEITADRPLQIGGNATVGKGLVSMIVEQREA